MNKFLDWINEWQKSLKPLTLQESTISPEHIALVSVDMINGFCHQGPLASPAVKSIIPDVVKTFEECAEYGVKHFLLLQDAHDQQAVEFGSFPPHCQKGSEEAKTIPEILHFATLDKLVQLVKFEKNSLSPAYGTEFNSWVEEHPEVDTYIIVGNCTDLCIYSMAMHLRLSANAQNIQRRIIIPENAVSTYDVSVETAKKIGAVPHEKNILHPIFLYHMMLNGVDVVSHLWS